MKKILLIILILLIAILAPIIGMGIGETRELILGLAPEDAILELADKIDINKVNLEDEITNLEGIIDSQEEKILEQQKIINSQTEQISSQTESLNVVTTSIDSDCQKKLEYHNKRIAEEKNEETLRILIKNRDKLDCY